MDHDYFLRKCSKAKDKKDYLKIYVAAPIAAGLMFGLGHFLSFKVLNSETAHKAWKHLTPK